MLSKEECYNQATLEELSNSNGTRQDVINKAMSIHAQQMSIGFAEWIHKKGYCCVDNMWYLPPEYGMTFTHEQLYQLYLKHFETVKP